MKNPFNSCFCPTCNNTLPIFRINMSKWKRMGFWHPKFRCLNCETISETRVSWRDALWTWPIVFFIGLLIIYLFYNYSLNYFGRNSLLTGSIFFGFIAGIFVRRGFRLIKSEQEKVISLDAIRELSKMRKCLNICVILILVFIMFFGSQTFMYFFSHYEKKNPYLRAIPETRTINSKQLTNGTRFNAYGYRIYLPSADSPQINSSVFSKSILFPCKFGIMMYKRGKNIPSNMYEHFKMSEKEDDIIHFKRVFDEKFHNKFDYVKSFFYARRTILQIFKSPEEATLLFYQLTDKDLSSIKVKKYPARIYYFETEHCKGFQLADPVTATMITLRLFSSSDDEIDIDILAGEIGKITQDEIDVIIASFRKN